MSARRLEGTGRRVQEILQGEDRQRLSRRSARAALGRDRRRVRILDGGEGGHLSPRREHHRPAGHCGQRGADGVRQHGREFRHRRLLHARPFHGRKDFLRRLPDQRAGRGRGGGHPHADASGELAKLHAQGLQAARKSAPNARKTLPRHAGHGVHRRRGQALHAANPHWQAHARGTFPDRRGHGQRRPDHPRRSPRAHQAGRHRAAFLSRDRLRRCRERSCTSANSPTASMRFPAPRSARPCSPRTKPKLGREGRKSHPGAPRNQPGRRGRNGRGAGNSDGDRRKDQPRRGGRARLGQVLHRGRGNAGH